MNNTKENRLERATTVVSSKLCSNNDAHERDISEKMADFATSEIRQLIKELDELSLVLRVAENPLEKFDEFVEKVRNGEL